MNKKVLVTGNTGFKGSWLTIWLLKLGANVIGYSKDVPSVPSIFEEAKLANKISHFEEDIRDLRKFTDVLNSHRPDFLFHLAAQPIVSSSYKMPLETISSNVMGTANVLDALKSSNLNCSAIIITSDKAYDNIEQVWGYKEDDKMGGKDIYSGSKGAAELIIHSYLHSFFKESSCKVKIAVGRAGNVIGGGDWAQDRIVVDCVKAWSQNKTVDIRSPHSTRPWQHVLEPLSGYLRLGQVLNNNKELNGEAFNFGPNSEQNHTVKKLIDDLSQFWKFKNKNHPYKVINNNTFHEAGLLKLNCDKALHYLNWIPSLSYKDTIRFTSEWYYTYYNSSNDILNKTIEQISEYENTAKAKKINWTE